MARGIVRFRLNGKQVSRKLADYNDQYRTKRSVRPLADEIIDPLNQGREVNEAVRRDALQKTDSEDRATVLEWAERQADRIGPLKPNPPSFVDDKEKVIRRLQAAEGWWWARNASDEESESEPSKP